MKTSSTWLLAFFSIIGIAAYFFLNNKQKEDNLKSIRNNWSNYIYTETIHYEYSQLGGINEFDIPLRNNTDYVIDEVDVTINYIKAAGGIYKTETVAIQNIAPHSIKTGHGPSSPRGTSIDTKISQAFSRGMHLCYPNGDFDTSNPYFCK